jgi:hypothetical protein
MVMQLWGNHIHLIVQSENGQLPGDGGYICAKSILDKIQTN